jgi:sodium transport system permease protein
MLNSIIVARKELIDHLRDSRALLSTAVYAFMGPGVVWMVLLATAEVGGNWRLYAVMAAVFTLLSAFSGGNSVAIDLIAGERERKSLLPLLANGVSRAEIVIGKWLATSAFAALSGLVTLLAFALVFAVAPTVPAMWRLELLLIPSLLFLAPFAAALQLLVSSLCRNVKEANAYLTIMIFVVMGICMWLAFSPGKAEAWWFLLPISGHQHVLQTGLANAPLSLLGSVSLAAVSLALAAGVIAYTGRLFQRDAIVYGD